MKILIAGASGGIGKYLAGFLSEDNQVFGTYKTRPLEISASYSMQRVDIRCEEQVAEWIHSHCTEIDELVLIYCVGVNYNRMMHKGDAGNWKNVIDSNLIGVYHVLRHLLPIMRNRKFGRIILLSSVVPQIGIPGTSAYSASKAALWGLSKAVAKENAAYGITINTINLGYFDIGMIHDVPPEILDKIIQGIPMGRLGDPVNILRAVEFLISADYISGSQIDLNGGLL